MQHWPYFELRRIQPGQYILVDEDETILLKTKTERVIVSDFAEAEKYLEENDIRGTVKGYEDE